MSDFSSISVIIPSRNYGKYIGEAIQSVLKQTWLPKEIIVIDDGSTDNTFQVVSGFSGRVRYFPNSKKGLGSARNTGISLSTGDYIAHLDADDIWMPERLEVQIRKFREDPGLDIAGGMMQPFFSPEIAPENRKKIHCSPVPLRGFSASVILVKRTSFLRVGYYREDTESAVDLEWFLRAREVPLKEAMVDRVIAVRRLHDTNSSRKILNSNRDRIRALKESLDRRRKKRMEGKQGE